MTVPAGEQAVTAQPLAIQALLGVSSSESGSRRMEILEGLVLLPPVGTKVSFVRREDPAVAEILGQENERDICQVHRKIGVLLHQLNHPSQVVFEQIEDLESPSRRRTRNCRCVSLLTLRSSK